MAARRRSSPRTEADVPPRPLTDEEVIARWTLNPDLFVLEAIRPKRITSQQLRGLQEWGKLIRARLHAKQHAEGLCGCPPTAEERAYNAKKGLSIQSGQGTGKDAFAAWLILHALVCFPYVKIPCTAPTGHQLRDVLWSEVQKWIRWSVNAQVEAFGEKDALRLDQWITWGAERIYLTELKGREWFAVPRTANPKGTAEEQAETLAGFHEDFMVIVADEASGIPDPVFRPLEGTLTGAVNLCLLIFNPTRSTGFAIETQQAQRAAWIPLWWNAEESELVTREHIAYMARKYGRDSNAFRVRVLGLPPKADPDILIPWDWVMDAVDRDVAPAEDDPLVAGADIARGGGDKSILLYMRGHVVGEILERDDVDTEILANWFGRSLLDALPLFTFVDAIGLGGPVADKLRARCAELQVLDVNVAELPADEDRYHRLRDELWFRVRDLFEKRVISIPNDDELIGELTTIRLLSPTEKGGLIRVESKKDMKARGLLSPNKADALCLTQYYETETRRRMGGRHQARRRQPQGSQVSWKAA